MMGPALFELCSGDPALQALLGTSPFRMFPAGDAPQDVSRPYVAWQTVGGAPENYLATNPDIDQHLIQVDVYSPDLAQGRAIARAIRDVVQQRCHVTAFRGESREVDTRLYRVSFDLTWYEPAP